MEREMYWSRFAADFEERSNYVVGKDNIDSIKGRISELEKLGTVLELGCGPGSYTNNLAENARRVIATDFSEEMVAAAGEKFKSHPKIKVERANCCSIGYPDESFDTVFMANLLHVIAEPEKALKESHRVLKTGGRVIAASFTAQGMKFFHKLGMFRRYMKTWGKPPAEGTVLTLEKVERMMTECGFCEPEGDFIGNTSKCLFVRAWKK